jgi:'Cold-shock' DNA-binding domain
MAMATGTLESFNATKGFGFIQPTDGGTDVSFISAVSSAAEGVTSTKARRSPMMLLRSSAPAGRQLQISNQRDEEYAYPVAPPFN